MTPRVRRFVLLVLGFTAYAAFTVLTPTRVWASIMIGVCLVLLLWLCWWVAKEPVPWRLPWRRP